MKSGTINYRKDRDIMKNKKGFTLIELLAVLVVLAVIALIATPTVLNSIASARTQANKESARGYVKALELACTTRLLTSQTTTFAEAQAAANFKGTLPTVAGTLTMGSDCTLSGTGTLNTFTLASLDN
jgi:prepilin-type N-terminal cleavage/methylation domain-containing protein